MSELETASKTSSESAGFNPRRSVGRLLTVVVGMFAFGFALVPLYDVICDVTGLNGKTGDQYTEVISQSADPDRVVTMTR